MQKNQLVLSTLFVILSSIGFGTVPFFAKSLSEAGMASPAIAFYRFALTALVLIPFLHFGKGMRMATFWGLLAGIGMGIGWIGYVRALDTMPVSTLGVLYMTYPLFTVLIAWLGFHDYPTIRSLASVALIFLAAFVALSPTATGVISLSILFFAFLAPLGFGFAINVLTNILIQLPPLSRIACVSLGSVLGIAPLILSLEPESILPSSTAAWWLIAGIALITALIPQLVYTVNAPRIGAARTAVAGSIELPTMFVVAWIAFGESLNLLQLIAGIIVVMAIIITPTQEADNNLRR